MTLRRQQSLLTSILTALLLASPLYTIGNTPAYSLDLTDAKQEFERLITPIKDLEAAVKVTKYEPAALEKIGSDFKTTYSIRSLTLFYKQHDKIRLDGRSATRGNASFIINGAMRYVMIPRINIKTTENLTDKPGKRQSLLEYAGLLTKGTLDFMQPKLLREEKEDGKTLKVFELRYQGEQQGSYFHLWIDTETGISYKREWFDSAGKLRARFQYDDAKELESKTWVPTRVHIHNADGEIAAVLVLSEIKINQGLDDSLFQVKP